MAPLGQNEGIVAPNFIEMLRIMRRALPNEPPSLSSSPSGRQAIDSSHTLIQESSSLPADPEYISITTLWPHEPDLPPGSSSTSQDGLLHALGYTQVENIYGVERLQPSTLNAPNSPRVVHTTGHETLDFLSSAAGQQVLPSQFDYERCLNIAKVCEDNEGAITFDNNDDEEFFLCLGPPTGRRRYSPPPILKTSPESVPGGMDLPFYDWDEVFDCNPPVCKELDPAAPVFEYQPSHACIQDTAPGAVQQDHHPQHSIFELPEPELPAETLSAPAPGPDQQAGLVLDLQPHAPQQRRLPRLRDMPYYHEVRQEEAELRAQRQRQRNGNGSANGNGIARSQRSQNDNATFGPSQGPYRPTRSNGFMATATPSRGSAGSSRSMAFGSHNGSSGFPRARNGSFNPQAASPSSWVPKPRSNPPSPTRSSPSMRSQTGSNSSGTTATAGPSNSVERPATPGPSREPRANPATKGKARAYTKAASPPRSPPAPTTGVVGVPAAATRPRGGGVKAKSWRQSPPAQAAESSTTTDQNSSATPQSPTQTPTQTRATNGNADVGPSTEGSSVPAEPARISHQESVVTTRPPMPQPTPTSTGGGVADAGPSIRGKSAQVNFTGRDWGHAIFEKQMESYRRSK